MNGYFGNEGLNNVNLLTIDYTDNYDLDMRSYFQSINDGTSGIKALLYIINAANKSEYAIYRWSNFTDKVTYGHVDIQYLKDSGNDDVELINNNNYKIQLFKHGDRGSQGYQGSVGLRGYQGTPGSFGGASFDYTFNGSGTREVDVGPIGGVQLGNNIIINPSPDVTERPMLNDDGTIMASTTGTSNSSILNFWRYMTFTAGSDLSWNSIGNIDLDTDIYNYKMNKSGNRVVAVSYTHLRAH